jgi:hypothetical protein
LDEIDRRMRVVAARQTDHERWRDAASYEPDWAGRGVEAARLLRGAGWVCDIGCGMQTLRQALPADVIYLPCDLRQWTPRVEPCDLNAGVLPVRSLARCDVVCLLGVLEYIYHPARLLAALARYAEGIVVSYNVPELADHDRAGFGWVNALSGEALTGLLRDAGYATHETVVFQDRELLVRAALPGLPLHARLRRAVARRAFAAALRGAAPPDASPTPRQEPEATP